MQAIFLSSKKSQTNYDWQHSSDEEFARDYRFTSSNLLIHLSLLQPNQKRCLMGWVCTFGVLANHLRNNVYILHPDPFSYMTHTSIRAGFSVVNLVWALKNVQWGIRIWYICKCPGMLAKSKADRIKLLHKFIKRASDEWVLFQFLILYQRISILCVDNLVIRCCIKFITIIVVFQVVSTCWSLITVLLHSSSWLRMYCSSCKSPFAAWLVSL